MCRNCATSSLSHEISTQGGRTRKCLTSKLCGWIHRHRESRNLECSTTFFSKTSSCQKIMLSNSFIIELFKDIKHPTQFSPYYFGKTHKNFWKVFNFFYKLFSMIEIFFKWQLNSCWGYSHPWALAYYDYVWIDLLWDSSTKVNICTIRLNKGSRTLGRVPVMRTFVMLISVNRVTGVLDITVVCGVWKSTLLMACFWAWILRIPA